MVIIRNITPEDYGETITMIQLTIRVSFQNLYPQELISAFCEKYERDDFIRRNEEIEYLIAEDNVTHQIIGIIGLRQDQLRSFFVHPQHQHQGIGRLLYTHIEHIAKSKKLPKLTVAASPVAVAVYLHFGFVQTGTLNKERRAIPYVDVLLEKNLQKTEIEKRLD